METNLDLMRRRHAHYSQLIKELQIKTAKEFYDKLRDRFELYGVELELSAGDCGIYLSSSDGLYEEYHVLDGQGEGLAVVSSRVWYQHPIYCCNLEAELEPTLECKMSTSILRF